jgi:hypothetical protein
MGPMGRAGKPAGVEPGEEDRAVTKGDDCDYIMWVLSHLIIPPPSLTDIPANPGCTDGTKFVLKGRPMIRKQFLLLDNSSLAFVAFKKKFPECTSFADITSSVTCKEISGLAGVDLAGKTTGARKGVVTKGNRCEYIK